MSSVPFDGGEGVCEKPRSFSSLRLRGLRNAGGIVALNSIEDCVNNVANEAVGIHRVHSAAEATEIMSREREELKKSCGYRTCSCLFGCLCLPCAFGCCRHVVPSGSVGLTKHKGSVMMTPAGVVWTTNPHESFHGVATIDDPVVNHGGVYWIVTIQDGNIGVVSNNGKIHFLGPGMYCWKSVTCNFLRSVNISSTETWTQLSHPFAIHIVKNNTVSAMRDATTGDVIILDPGIYLVDETKATRIYVVNTNVCSETITDECTTKDNHRLRVVFSKTYVVNDPFKFVTSVSDWKTFQKQTFDAAVTQVVASFFFADLINTDRNKYLTSADLEPNQSGSRDDDFLFLNRTRLQDDCLAILRNKLSTYGLELRSMSILEITVVDPTVSSQISSAASATVKMQNELRNMQIQQEIAEKNKLLMEKQAEADAARDMVHTLNSAKRKQIEAEATATAVEIEARGKATSIRQVGEAEAAAIRARAGAELDVWVAGIANNPKVADILVAKQQALATSSASIVGGAVITRATTSAVI